MQRVLIIAGLALVANLWAAAYVSAERYIYYWDWAGYWLRFAEFGALLRTDPGAALALLQRSISFDDYNLLPVLPLVPFEWAFGGGRASYILAVTTLAVIPAAVLFAAVAERIEGERSTGRFAVTLAAILGLHVLWAPALRGLPDAMGLVVAGGFLLIYLAKPIEQQGWRRLVLLGGLLGLMVLTRRWNVFWVASVFPAALVAYWASVEREQFSRVVRALAIVGGVCLICLMVFAAPLLVRAFVSNYAVSYAGYAAKGVGPLAQIVGHYGLGVLLLGLAGLFLWVCRRETRPAGVFLIVQAGLSVILFSRVQGMFGVHHYYLLLPAVALGVAGLVACSWGLSTAKRLAGLAGLFGVVLASSAVAFGRNGGQGPLLPAMSYPPLVRDDLGELRRLVDRLDQLEGGKVYVAASSDVLNWSILQAACRGWRPALCARILVTQEVDSRDGPPTRQAQADYVVVATPTQYHLAPQNQRAVALVADGMRAGRDLGAGFEKMPEEYRLGRGVTVGVYRRTTAPDRTAKAR